MPSFEYEVINQKGKEIKGSMEGANKDKVIAELKADGYIPLKVNEQNFLNKDLSFHIGSGVKPRDLSVFCRQFVSIISAGVTVINALQMLGEQTENKNLRKAIREVQTSIEKGESLAASMKNQGKIFPDILINMVEAGEASGSLEVAFDRMASHFEKEAKLKGLVKQAMIYPIVVCVVAIGVICTMIIYVVPKFENMFQQIDAKLPAITLFMISVSNFMVHYWWLLLLIFAALAAGISAYRKSPAGKEFLGRLALKLPLFGNLAIKSSSARLTRTLSTLFAAGIPLVNAIDIAARMMDNVIIRQSLQKSKEEVARGIPLSQPLKACGLFPPMVYHMTEIGEETGNMEEMLDKIADYYDEEVEAATKALTTVLEPLIIVILAVIVGTIVLSIISPMMSLYNNIDKS